MATATLTSKGQITIPAAIRAALGLDLDAGCRIAFVETGKGSYEMVPATEPVQSLKGLLRKPQKPVSIEKMNEIIAARRI